MTTTETTEANAERVTSDLPSPIPDADWTSPEHGLYQWCFVKREQREFDELDERQQFGVLIAKLRELGAFTPDSREVERLQIEISRLLTALEACRDCDSTPASWACKTPQQIAGLAIGGHKSVMQVRWECQGERIQTLHAEVERLKGELAAALKFKAFVHARLDAAGVPTHPDGPHSKEGCRIGDRLDIVLTALVAGMGQGESERESLAELRSELAKANRRVELYRRHDLGHLFTWCVENLTHFPPLIGEWTEEVKKRLLAYQIIRDIASPSQSTAAETPEPEPFPATTVRCWRDSDGDIWAIANGKTYIFDSKPRVVHGSELPACCLERDGAVEIPPATAYADMLPVFPDGAARLMELCRANPKFAVSAEVAATLDEHFPLTAELPAQATGAAESEVPSQAIGPQRAAPATVAQIQAQTKQVSRAVSKSQERRIAEQVYGRLDKPFHRPECQCGECREWCETNPLQSAPSQPATAVFIPQFSFAATTTIGPQRAAPATKDHNTTCGKVGCGNPATHVGYKGSLKCRACAEHSGELEDVIGGPAPPQPVVESGRTVTCCGRCQRLAGLDYASAIGGTPDDSRPCQFCGNFDWLREYPLFDARARIATLEAQLAAIQSPQWITYTGQELEPGVWYSEATESVFVLPARGARLLSGCRYCRIGPVPTREGEVG